MATEGCVGGGRAMTKWSLEHFDYYGNAVFNSPPPFSRWGYKPGLVTTSCATGETDISLCDTGDKRYSAPEAIRIQSQCIHVETEECQARSTTAATQDAGSVIYLDRHAIDCNAGLSEPEWLLSGWTMKNLEPDMKIEYECCKRAQSEMVCATHNTATKAHNGQTKSIEQLGDVGASCGDTEALGGWKYVVSGSQAYIQYTCCKYTHTRYSGNSMTVFASGEPQMDRTAMYRDGTPDVWITLSEKTANLGTWTPFSWYGHLISGGVRTFDPLRWGAVMKDATDASLVETLLDRGYGHIYLTSEETFSDPSTIVSSVLAELETRSGNRRLTEVSSGRALSSVAAARWTCDDTRMKCGTVCMATTGVTTRIVSNSECTEPKPDMCCSCYYDAKWECTEQGAVCKASIPGEGEVLVGDLVCEMRGTPKPEKPAVEESAKAICTPMGTRRGERPSEACLASANLKGAAAWGGDSTMPDIEMTLMNSASAFALALALAVVA
jgi:hypothetical protein